MWVAGTGCSRGASAPHWRGATAQVSQRAWKGQLGELSTLLHSLMKMWTYLGRGSRGSAPGHAGSYPCMRALTPPSRKGTAWTVHCSTDAICRCVDIYCAASLHRQSLGSQPPSTSFRQTSSLGLQTATRAAPDCLPGPACGLTPSPWPCMHSPPSPAYGLICDLASKPCWAGFPVPVHAAMHPAWAHGA